MSAPSHAERPMRLLVLGAAGQVGRALLAHAPEAGVEAVGLDRRALDVADAEAVRRAVRAAAPDAVVNAAAYTAVDRAEAEPEQAFAVNGDGAAHVARACAEAGALLLYLSTDYVFDGTKPEPYVEDDPPNPLGVYGRSKWVGEQAVRAALPPERHLIVRTAWVFSVTGSNFVRTILRLARERELIRVVADQRGCPTAAADLAAACPTMLRALAVRPELGGTYHWAGQPPTTWHGLAEAVVAEARRRGPVAARFVEPIPTSAYPTAAPRPPSSALATSKAERAFGLTAPDWRLPLPRVVEDLVAGRGYAGHVYGSIKA